MAIIRGSITYRGEHAALPFDEVSLELSLPRFQYEGSAKKLVHQIELPPSIKTLSHDLSNTNYHFNNPSSHIVGEQPRLFWNWIKDAIKPPFSINEFRLDIPYSILTPEGIEIAHGCFGAYYFIDILPLVGTSDSGSQNLLKKLFIVNDEVFYTLLEEIRPYIETNMFSDEMYLLMLICEIGQFTENRIDKSSMSDQDMQQIISRWQQLKIPVSQSILESISSSFEALTSFPIEIPPLIEVRPAGSFHVITALTSYPRSELVFYRLTVEAQIRTGVASTQYRSWNINWDNIDTADPVVEPIPFSFAPDPPIIASGVEGSLVVRVIGFNGSTLWRHAYSPESDELGDIEIVIDANLPSRLSSDQISAPKSSRRIRGQVIASDRSRSVDQLTVVLQAQISEEAIWQIVSSAETSDSGHFSMKYPKGHFVAAQALVSVAPNSVVDIEIVDTGIEDETISDNYLYLLIDSTLLPGDVTSAPGHVPRLPDHADLIGSGEYSQDLSGQCVNITTPNRTLREYSYNAIVRVSDPDVANYTLEKTADGFQLTGGERIIERAPVNLSNPIRWQDAPDGGDNVSFYQAVTVATGHILFYKSVFKADGYSMGDLVYSLPLAPGQKKQIVSYDVANTLEASEDQRRSQGERLSAELLDDRFITDKLGGGINETLSGRSTAHTSGFSAGLGLGVSAGKFGGSLGVAGGFSNARSSASQSGARDISEFFSEKLRQALIQNAESYRELNASVVTTVKEGQEYSVTTEVVANHNHCHSITMMFFEVLRHYAITQELADVQECVFVPLLLTDFTQANISKFKDVLAANLLPIPSSTYLQPRWLSRLTRRHPLLKAFDANERQNTDYAHVNFPEGRYADDDIISISGEIRIRTRLPRPKTGFDRILSLPVISTTVRGDFDKERSLLSHAPGGERPGIYYKSEEVQERVNISNEFMQLDANYESVPPAQAIRVITFKPQTITLDDGTTEERDGFDNNDIDKGQWEDYANILGDFTDVYEMMDEFFAGRLVSEWDRIFNQDLAPLLFNKIVDSIKLDAPVGEGVPSLDLTLQNRYKGGEKSMRIHVHGSAHPPRSELSNTELRLHSNNEAVHQLREFATLIVENVRIQYTTEYFEGSIYNGYLGNDLLDEDFATSGATFPTPLTERDKRDARKEDEYLVEQLLEHLNSNLEHYNKVLWRTLDPDRRYMLLDGFSIEVFDRAGSPIEQRSLASVVKNDLITIAGNSLIFPVADGYHVSQTHVVEGDEEAPINLLDYYRPTQEVEPYRLSVPTRGVYMESVMGKCDACEDVKEDSSQDWSRFGTEEPTAIAPVVTPTPARTDWRAIWAQFAQPLISIQTPREAPAPGAGLQGLSEALTNAEAFRDITGLAGNQENVIRTYLSNQENARAFAEMAKEMAMQEHNSENSRSIMQSLDNARERGAISDNDYSDLVRDHLGQQIDGGARRQAEERHESSHVPSLTNAAIDAVEDGRSVRAERNEPDGNRELIEVTGRESEEGNISIEHNISPIQQPSSRSCWATAATMLINWKNRSNVSIEEVLREAGLNLSPPEEEHFLRMFTENTGLPSHEKNSFVNALEMLGEPPRSYTLEQYIEWLRNYGPLWITTDSDESEEFSPHARILYGIEGNASSEPDETDLLFVDPATGLRERQSFQEFIVSFKQMFTDLPPEEPLYVQVVHFRARISFSSEGEQAGSRIWMQGVPRDTNSSMSQFKERLIELAWDEYEYWHRPGGPPDREGYARWEIDADMKERLRTYWRACTNTDVRGRATQDFAPNDINTWVGAVGNEGRAWSAIFISYLISQAGITQNDAFIHSQRHVDFIAQACLNRENQVWQNPFWAYRINEYPPEPGDIVGRTSANPPLNYNTVVNRTTGIVLRDSSHTDIVIEKNTTDNYIVVIGGNLELNDRYVERTGTGWRNTVTAGPSLPCVSTGKRKIYLTDSGHIDPEATWEIYNNAYRSRRASYDERVQFTGPQNEYFAIIKIRTDPNNE